MNRLSQARAPDGTRIAFERERSGIAMGVGGQVIEAPTIFTAWAVNDYADKLDANMNALEIDKRAQFVFWDPAFWDRPGLLYVPSFYKEGMSGKSDANGEGKTDEQKKAELVWSDNWDDFQYNWQQDRDSIKLSKAEYATAISPAADIALQNRYIGKWNQVRDWHVKYAAQIDSFKKLGGKVSDEADPGPVPPKAEGLKVATVGGIPNFFLTFWNWLPWYGKMGIVVVGAGALIFYTWPFISPIVMPLVSAGKAKAAAKALPTPE